MAKSEELVDEKEIGFSSGLFVVDVGRHLLPLFDHELFGKKHFLTP